MRASLSSTVVPSSTAKIANCWLRLETSPSIDTVEAPWMTMALPSIAWFWVSSIVRSVASTDEPSLTKRPMPPLRSRRTPSIVTDAPPWAMSPSVSAALWFTPSPVPMMSRSVIVRFEPGPLARMPKIWTSSMRTFSRLTFPSSREIPAAVCSPSSSTLRMTESRMLTLALAPSTNSPPCTTPSMITSRTSRLDEPNAGDVM